jgi:hypothetical protein
MPESWLASFGMDAEKMKIAKESWIIAVLGAIDLITTIVFIQHHGAEEANPLFRFFWNIGLPVFICAKILLTACPLIVLEWARKRNPRFVQFGMRSAIAGYVCMYGLGFFHLNGPAANEREVMAAQQVSYNPQSEEEREQQVLADRQALLRMYTRSKQSDAKSRSFNKHDDGLTENDDMAMSQAISFRK